MNTEATRSWKHLPLPPTLGLGWAFCAILWLSVCANGFAQQPAAAPVPQGSAPISDGARKFAIGLKAGLSFSNYYGDSLAHKYASRMRLGPVAGLTFRILLDEQAKSRLYFAPEVLFHVRGTERTWYVQRTKSVSWVHGGNTDVATLDSSSHYLSRDVLGYLQVPLLFRADFGYSGVRAFVSMGPVAGFNLLHKNKLYETVTTQQVRTDAQGNWEPDPNLPTEFAKDGTQTLYKPVVTDVKQVNRFDLGGILAVGCSFPVTSRLSILVEGRADLSFTPLFTEYRLKNRNQSLMLLMGVEF